MNLPVRRRLLSLLLPGVLALVGAVSPAQAQERMSIGYIATSIDTEPAMAVLTEAYGRLGIELDLVGIAGSGSLVAADAGELDGELMRIEALPARFSNLVRVDAPVSILQAGILTTDSELDASRWVDLRRLHVGAVRGILFIEESLLSGPVTWVDSYDELYAILLAGEIEAAVVPKINGQEALDRLGAPLVMLDATLQTNLLYHYVHRRHAELVPQLRAVLKDMLLSGRTQELIGQTLETGLSGGSP